MPVKKLIAFLDDHDVRYVTLSHSRAFTAQQIAAAAHIPGRMLAKTVMVHVDGEMAMVVMPASAQLDFDAMASAIDAREVTLATERAFKDLFPDCEVGAMPPFGNLYGMDVYVDDRLAEDEEIAFNAGTHTELIQLAYADFERLVRPTLVHLAPMEV